MSLGLYNFDVVMSYIRPTGNSTRTPSRNAAVGYVVYSIQAGVNRGHYNLYIRKSPSFETRFFIEFVNTTHVGLHRRL